MITIALLDGPLATRDFSEISITPAEMHARAVMAAIKSVNQDVLVLSFPVFKDKLSTHRQIVVESLITAMRSDASILHCSFGFPDEDPATASAFNGAVKHFRCVVASSPSRGNSVYPASYPGVLKASGDARAIGRQFTWLNTSTVDFAASPRAPEGFEIAGASIGAARISGLVAGLIDNEGYGVDIRERLAELANYKGPERKL